MSNGKGKGKDDAGTPLPAPHAGSSASPSSSFPALVAYLDPALDHIVRAPSDDPERAPAIDFAYSMGIHTAVYNYFTQQSQALEHVDPTLLPASLRAPAHDDDDDHPRSDAPLSGSDLYCHLDAYFTAAARDLYLGAPQDDGAALVRYLVPAFTRYAAGARAVHRLLNYVNRHFVKRAADEDRGWLRLGDMLDAVVASVRRDDASRERIALLVKERRLEELQLWGYPDGGGGSSEEYAAAEACAEAASAPDRVVHIAAAGLRRFRTEVLEPLLAIPKAKKKKKKRKQPAQVGGAPPADGEAGGSGAAVANGARPPGPRSRLARAVKEVLESEDVDDSERRRLAEGLARMLKTSGIRPEHALRRKVEKYLSCST
ncbi:hypothetical protein PUNSTDRAFT_117087 [Punctularia strigosozonata HHB-11173 SS5]|uniref:uncharacterized protein n=1 Tax=Punctularia strigosozonata (strain HHB-11173) TaxID=741275 RepID=UPI00044175A2|nr:uncharacterized protein PUNSTDRAFT_117087 [Punctularia strigosozonata HHB-11173 SS5]EIN13199.1 hypothetical protein PUNSTDRAFT_117087 [Punctularia strigosozonata HHB-11173 SS5]